MLAECEQHQKQLEVEIKVVNKMRMTINYRESTTGDTTNQPTAGEIPLEGVNLSP